MNTLFLASCLCFLMIVHGTVENHLPDNIITPGELKELDDLEFGISSWETEHVKRVSVNVDDFGAIGNGDADDTQAFRSAWTTACSTENAVFLVPCSSLYLVRATRFRGPCSKNLVIQINGIIKAPDDPESWDPNDMRIWLSFSDLEGVRIQGKGILDGSGEKWWQSSCKRDKTKACRGAPTAFSIISSSAVSVKGLTFKNSQQMHFVIDRCDSVSVSGVQIYSPSDSPNTDGIHVTKSINVLLQDAIIETGDDCISIVNGSSAIKMKKIKCGPGHGISIGSLGKNSSTGIVTKVFLDTAVINGTTNGLRIKSWPSANGYVRGIVFSGVKMENVTNPIIIDQNYCDSPTPCPKLDTSLQISKVVYNNILGTSSSKVAMKFDCSSTAPCVDIVLKNVILERVDGPAETVCNFATGRLYGVVEPVPECLKQMEIAGRDEL